MERGIFGTTAADPRGLARRHVLAASAGFVSAPLIGGGGAGAAGRDGILIRPIPSSGECIPAIGLGTWVAFNVGTVEKLRRQRLEVLHTFFDLGGGLIDSSPMYGSSEEVVGWCLERLDDTAGLMAATKVWTRDEETGRGQIAESRRLWGIDTFDVMQVHNLLNWQGHLETLRAEKEAGRVRYIGVTTSHGSRHAAMERVMREAPIDFVQFTYNILDREVENHLLPLAAERGLGVIVNRPFRQKQLIDRLRRHPLPDWAADFDAANWPQFLLKFIISHPAVTCAIPATSRVDHMAENMGALRGRLPEPETRHRMVDYVEGL